MTSSILHKTIVLVLNRQWMPIDSITPADAFAHLATGRARALHISEESMIPLGWEAWQELVPGEDDHQIGTTSGPLLVPTVLLLSNYDKVPMIYPSFGFNGIWERDGGRCQYSGRQLEPSEANVDHVVPKSRGGGDAWENCVLADRRINTRKGSKTPDEAGLKLLRKPYKPTPVPATLRIRNTWKIREWDHFLNSPA